MIRDPGRCLAALVAVTALSGVRAADTATEAYAAMGIRQARVLSGTVMSAQIIPEGEKEVVAIVTYLTGKREKHDAVNVRLEVLSRTGGPLATVYARDFGAELAGNVGAGELQVVDLDGDGVNEIIVSLESYADPLVEQRLGEVILYDRSGFRAGWSGTLAYDATRDARSLPPERRDRYRREIDVPGTLATRGATLVVSKHVIAVAGERLAAPQRLRETFPLKSVTGSP